MSGLNMDLQGIDSLMAQLKELQGEAAEKLVKSALGSGAKVITEAAKSNAQRVDSALTTEFIAANIVQRPIRKSSKARGQEKIRIGVLGGARDMSAYGEVKTGKSASSNPGGDTFYWRFLEFGTQKMAARPFMRPAMESNATAATNVFLQALDKKIGAALRKAKKK